MLMKGDILNLLSRDFSLRGEADSMPAERVAEVTDGRVRSHPVVLSLNYEKSNHKSWKILGHTQTTTVPGSYRARIWKSDPLLMWSYKNLRR